jgi:glyoxylase-like metal-dependent hydrolase (beta-lactamase superfamily II)
MRISKLHTNPTKYNSNVYLIRGDFNALTDCNTLIDTGADDFILNQIDEVYTGVGKKKIDRVILTHNHFDHTGGLKYIIERFQPEIYSFHEEEYTNHLIRDNDIIKVGDEDFIVIHTPYHSHDSICLYNYKSKILFSGDTQLFITSESGSYSSEYYDFILRLSRLGVNKIFPGHGQAIADYIEEQLHFSLEMMEKQKIDNKKL